MRWKRETRRPQRQRQWRMRGSPAACQAVSAYLKATANPSLERARESVEERERERE